MHILISALGRFTHPTGVCRHAVNLARCLAEADEVRRIALVIGDWQREYYAGVFRLPAEKVDVIAVQLPNNSLARNKFFLFALPELAKKKAADVVHLAFPLPFLRARFPCPVVATIHDVYPVDIPENFGFPNAWFNRAFFLKCLANSAALACVSDFTQRRLGELFPYLPRAKPVRTIHNYVEFETITSERPDIDNISHLPYLLSVAQHRKNKNLPLLVSAYARLLAWSAVPSETKLVIAGMPGPETPAMRALIDTLRLGDRVLLPPALPEAHLCWLYQNCAAFVAPSSHEGFCLPLAEALHFNCRVVCSDIAIFREVGSDDCTYFSLQGEATDQLAAAVVQALGRARPTHINSRHTKSSARAHYLALYSEVLHAPARRGASGKISPITSSDFQGGTTS